MPIASFDDLVSKIPQWAERNDISTEMIEDFLYLAESDVSAAIRVPAMENTETLTIVNGRVNIPFDYLELRRLTVEGPDRTLKYLPWDQFVLVNRDGGEHLGSDPMYYSRQGAKWFVSPVPEEGRIIQCHYYRIIPPISATQQSNWLVKISPMSYLYGGLKHLYEYILDDERAAYWGARFDREINKLQAMSDRAEHSGTILTMRQTY